MSEAPNTHDRAHFSLEEISARMQEARRQRRLQHRSPDTLHVRPNLDHYREQARTLLWVEQHRDPSFKLHAALLAVARGVGFASWPKLVSEIRARNAGANDLRKAITRRDDDAVVQIVREYPPALLDAGCIASPDELQLLLRIVPISRREPDTISALLDAIAEHHKPEGLSQCVGLLLGLGAEPDYANETIEERRARAALSTNGEHAIEEFDNALGVLAWYVDEPEFDYMSEND